jgi:DNA polymerase III epsilon subunit-like protein
MSERCVVVFDTETTGLTLHPDAPLAKQPKIIELGAALVDASGAVVEEFTQLIHPGEPLSAEITRITGITDAALVGAPGFGECLPQLRHVFGQACAVFAHNLPFDKALLRFELQRAGVTDFPWPEREYCTVGLHRDSWGRNPKLTELYAHVLGRPLPQTHRALDDVLALVEVVVALELHTLAFEEVAA